MKPSFTLGIEEEYQTIDPSTFDLRSHIHTELIAQGKVQLQEKVKAEMHQSVIEVGTGICRTIGEAREDVVHLRRQTVRLAKEHGLLLAAGATHPFADWRVQDIYPDERYLQVVEDMQTVARSNLIFGLHVHVGIEDRETSIHLMNQVRYFLPHLLALSTNSPFWLGMNTGLKSYRCKVFDKFPRTNIPETFASWADFEGLVNLLIRTNCIDNAKRIWWDVRPHPFFSTLCKLYKLHSRNQGYRVYGRALIMENKWRASRYGLDGMLIDFGREKEVPARELILEYLDFVDDVLDELECRKEVEYVQTMLDRGTGADRQLKVFAETGDLRKVVEYIVHETETGL
jgi:carboxylate-amine ligase